MKESDTSGCVFPRGANVLELPWHVGTNMRGQSNIWAGEGADVTPAIAEDYYAMDRDVCEHIVELHNAWLIHQPGEG